MRLLFLRDGKVTGHVRTLDTNEQDLARMMVGKRCSSKSGKGRMLSREKKHFRYEHLKC